MINIRFPRSIKKDYFTTTNTHTTCPWKGVASYYTIDVDGKQTKDAAWYYPEPYEKAKHIKDYVAFCKPLSIILLRRPSLTACNR